MTDELTKITGPAVREAAALPRRVVVVLGALLAVFLLCAAAVAWVLVSQHDKINDLSAQASANTTAAQQLAEQVKTLGAVPVATPAAGPAGAAGATGPAGVAGATGQQGPPGPAGPPGGTGPPGATGATGAAGTRGDTGTPGKDGATGAAGQDGAAGTAGPAGPAGPQGATGPAGAPGADGQDGQPPYGWTYTDELGVKHTCTRSADFDPSAPTYTCSATSTGG